MLHKRNLCIIHLGSKSKILLPGNKTREILQSLFLAVKRVVLEADMTNEKDSYLVKK